MYLIVNIPHSTCHQKRLLSTLIENLNVKNLIVLKEFVCELKIDEILLIKSFNKLYFQCMSFRQIYEIFECNTLDYKSKTLILLDDFSRFLPEIFQEKYSRFLSLSVWVLFEFNIENLENEMHIPYDCQFFNYKVGKF